MQEINNENSQYKYDDIDRPDNYGKNNPYDYDFKKPCPYGKCHYGQKWPHHYGQNWNMYGSNMYWPYFPGSYYGGTYGLPWLLLALKSMSPREIVRYMEEMEGMEL